MTNEELFYGTPKLVIQTSFHAADGGGCDRSGQSQYCKQVYEHINHAIDHVTIDGLYMEFGVYEGRTLRSIANKIAPKKVYGFDVFTTGLPDNWFCVPKGGFSTPVPTFEEPNIELVVGLYEDTLPKFELDQDIAFLHIDCDLYSSTKTVFDNFQHRIVPGTVIVFDEYHNYPGFEEHEYKAFKELLATRNLKAVPLGVMYTETSAPASFLLRSA